MSPSLYKLNPAQKALRAMAIAALTITIVFVLLRCLSRTRLQAQFSIDDSLLVAALVGFIIQTSFGICAMDYGGFGLKTAELPQAIYKTGLKFNVLAQCAYILAVMLVKLSIAFLQLRIMGLSNEMLRKIHYVSMGVNIVFGTYVFFTFLFQCYSIDSEQQPVVITSATCINRHIVVVSVYIYSAVNIVLDWYYSFAMVPLIWKLQNMKSIVRISVTFILGMGFFASIAAVVRIKYLVGFANSADPLYAFIPVALWSWIEECLSICAACIATFRPLLRLIPGLSSRGGGPPYHSAPSPFTAWKSRLEGKDLTRRHERGGVCTDGLDLEDLAEQVTVREEGVWEGEREYGGDGIAATTTTATMTASATAGDAQALRIPDVEVVSMAASSNDGAEVRTVADDADSQKSILQHKKSASQPRDS